MLENITVREWMSSDDLMLEHNVSGLPVVDDNDKLVGIPTESYIFTMLVELRTKAIITANA